jgi:oxygen-independent coproporphyrinogen-3 oxidase
MNALVLQMQHELKRFHATQHSIETLFIGGGTPSCVSAELYRPLFELLKEYLHPDAEITSEANPNSATKEWLSSMYKLGVNRISFGVQSFNEKKLKLLNRAHTPQMAKDAIKIASEVGFKNLSLDLIYATLGDTKELLENDLNEAFLLPINHLSAYALTIEENTPFAKKPQMSAEELSLTQWFFEAITTKGFHQYEISNFGKYRSRHNLGYWEYKEYMGVGAGAVGKYKNSRLYPENQIEAYITNPLNIQEEHLSNQDIHLERLFLGLRSCIGINKCFLNPDEQLRATLLCDEQRLTYKDGIFYNNDYLLADELTLYITN